MINWYDFLEDYKNINNDTKISDIIKGDIENMTKTEIFGYIIGLLFSLFVFISFVLGIFFIVSCLTAFFWNNSIVLMFDIPTVNWKNTLSFYGLLFITTNILKRFRK